MKTRYLATSLILAFSAPSSFAYEVIDNDVAYLHFYGQVKARALFLDEQPNDYTFGDSKVGVLGRYAITDLISLSAGTEAQINFDADEDRNEDDLYVSQYFVGIYGEGLGSITYGKHNTSSDDLNGVDYSEAFGGSANLNAVGVKGDTIKYVYDTDLFTANATYGFENGDLNREIAELFGRYNLADMVIIAGIGNSTTNTTRSQTDATYFQTTVKFEMGDTNIGATYYYNSTTNKLSRINSVDKNALAIAGQIAFLETLTGYSGYEVVAQSSDNIALDGNFYNAYLGASYLPLEWLKFFAEANHVNPINSANEVNFGIGAVAVW